MIKTPSAVPSFTTSAGTTAYGGGSAFTNDWNDDQKLVQAMAAPAAAAAPLPKTVEVRPALGAPKRPQGPQSGAGP